jgi:hypothetical protein
MKNLGHLRHYHLKMDVKQYSIDLFFLPIAYYGTVKNSNAALLFSKTDRCFQELDA